MPWHAYESGEQARAGGPPPRAAGCDGLCGAAGSQDGALNTARAPSPHWLMRRATATMSSGKSTDLSGSKSLGAQDAEGAEGAQGAQGAEGGC